MITQEAKRFKEFRLSLKKSQKDFAEDLGVNQDVISRCESGAYSITNDYVRTLHRKHKLNYEWFFDGVGRMRIDEPTRPTLVTDLKEVMLDLDIVKKSNEALRKQQAELTKKVFDLEEQLKKEKA